MGVSISSGVLVSSSSFSSSIFRHGIRVTELPKSGINLRRNRNNPLIKTHRLRTTAEAAAINEVSAAADPSQAEITWQIVVGALDSSEKVWGVWRLRTCFEGQILLPLPWLRWISPLAVMEKVLFWLNSLMLGYIDSFCLIRFHVVAKARTVGQMYTWFVC